LVATVLALREDGFGELTALEAAIFGLVTLAFLLVVNQLVAVVPMPTTAVASAIVGAATAVVAALAFRDVGPGVSTVPALATLLFIAAAIGGAGGAMIRSLRTWRRS
jgi:hypothetical protein